MDALVPGLAVLIVVASALILTPPAWLRRGR